MASTILDLAAGKVFALVNTYELDGRPSSHPFDMRGFSTMNCYLLLEDDSAVLHSTGYSVHQDALLEQLDQLIDSRPLTLLIPRVEYPSMCNARPIADRFKVVAVHQRVNVLPPADFLNFRPGFVPGVNDGLRGLDCLPCSNGDVVTIGSSGARALRFVTPELRLLPAPWAYDEATATLFAGDIFSWVWRDTPEGPWELDDSSADPTTPERVEDFLLHNRYWWLAGADTAPIRKWLAEFFQRYPVETIAPDHGCVLTGSAIGRHARLLDDFLAEAATRESIGLSVGRWSMEGVR